MRRIFSDAFLFLPLLFIFSTGLACAGEPSFTQGLHLYHTGRYEEALRVFRSLHEHQPSGTGKFQYFMALSEDHQGLEHQALMDLESAIRTNPGLTFTENPAHVRAMHKRLMHQVAEGQSPVPPPHPVSFPEAPAASPSHMGAILLLLAVGAVLLVLAIRKRTQNRAVSESRDKQEMEETAGRLMKAVDKLIDDKNYYLLDHPDKKDALEAAFRSLDPAYRTVLNILREPESPQTDWAERRSRFEAALAPVDAAILNIRGLLGESGPPPSFLPFKRIRPSARRFPPDPSFRRADHRWRPMRLLRTGRHGRANCPSRAAGESGLRPGLSDLPRRNGSELPEDRNLPATILLLYRGSALYGRRTFLRRPDAP